MNPQATKSYRLNHMLKMALNGRSYLELEKYCDSIGISPSTKKSYINAVISKIRSSVK